MRHRRVLKELEKYHVRRLREKVHPMAQVERREDGVVYR
jgi:hypothetical protein